MKKEEFPYEKKNYSHTTPMFESPKIWEMVWEVYHFRGSHYWVSHLEDDIPPWGWYPTLTLRMWTRPTGWIVASLLVFCFKLQKSWQFKGTIILSLNQIILKYIYIYINIHIHKYISDYNSVIAILSRGKIPKMPPHQTSATSLWLAFRSSKRLRGKLCFRESAAS